MRRFYLAPVQNTGTNVKGLSVAIYDVIWCSEIAAVNIEGVDEWAVSSEQRQRARLNTSTSTTTRQVDTTITGRGRRTKGQAGQQEGDSSRQVELRRKMVYGCGLCSPSPIVASGSTDGMRCRGSQPCVTPRRELRRRGTRSADANGVLVFRTTDT